MRGFTLIEALVAFSILAIVVGVTTASLSSGLAASGKTAAALDRLDQARALFAGIGVTGTLVAGESNGVFPTGETWRLTVEDAGTPQLYRVDLTVFEGDRTALTLSALKAGR